MTSAGRLVDLYTKPLPTAAAWVSNGILIKGGFLIMGGPAKIGKSWLAINAAEQLATGQALWGMWEVPQPVPTLYIDRELGIFGYHERVTTFYNRIGRKPSANLTYLCKPPGYFLDTGRGMALLAEQIEQTGAKVVILDPVSRCLSGDENSNTDVNAFFTKLTELQARFPDLSFIMSHHFGKAPKGDARDDYDPLDPYNFRGAGKWFDAPDTIITFSRQPGQEGEWWRLRYRVTKRHARDSDDQVFAIEDGGIVAPRACEVVKPKPGWGRSSAATGR